MKELLHLDGSPVAVKFIKSANQLHEGVPNIKETITQCQMVSRARKEMRIFYLIKENHGCMGGSWAPGLREMTFTLKSGEFYFKLGKYDS